MCFIVRQTRASVMEHSIDLILGLLTDIGSEWREIRKRAGSLSADGQTAHKKRRRARRRQPRITEGTAVKRPL